MAYVLFFCVLHFFHDPMNHNWYLIPCFFKHLLLGSDATVTWTIIRVWRTHKANASSVSCVSRQNSVNGPIMFQRVSAKEVCGGSSALWWLGQSMFSWKSQFMYSSGQQETKEGQSLAWLSGEGITAWPQTSSGMVPDECHRALHCPLVQGSSEPWAEGIYPLPLTVAWGGLGHPW